jgi:hypothetical protein
MSVPALVAATAAAVLLTERQISDGTRLRRVVALFQRRLGAIFGNASVTRRNRRYLIDVAVYEKPLRGGRPYRLPPERILAWVLHAAEQAHPKLYTRLRLDIGPWTVGRSSQKEFCRVRIAVAAETQA